MYNPEAQDLYQVYIQTNEFLAVTAINSSAFLPDATGWIQVDVGSGDRYHHAQGNYLEKPLMTMHGVYQYKLIDGRIVERTEAEIAADIAAIPAPPPTTDEVMEELVALLISQGVITNV